MIGNNSASVLVDAYMKGVEVEDLETLYEGLVHGTESVHPKVSSTGRLGYQYYNELGYVPTTSDQRKCSPDVGVCLRRLVYLPYGPDVNRPKEEVDRFARRAMNYRNLFDAESKLMRGKNRDGRFMVPFSPLKWGDAFTEGNSWHYSWSVFHDPQGLIDLMGGKEPFVQMLIPSLRFHRSTTKVITEGSFTKSGR